MEEVLDDRERYAAAMYDALIAEVRAAVEAEFEERAAIAEYEGGLSRADAESVAACMVIYGRLQPIRDVRP